MDPKRVPEGSLICATYVTSGPVLIYKCYLPDFLSIQKIWENVDKKRMIFTSWATVTAQCM